MVHTAMRWLLLALVFVTDLVLANSWHGHAVHVKAGQSIQAAIDAASPGSCIIVEAGTYAEQLTITTDHVKLVGIGAVLVPPSSFTTNTCTGLAGPDTEAGICITGQGIELADFVQEHRKVLSVGQPVKNVLVTGFEVRGFSGLDIAVVGGEDVEVIGNTLYDGVQYGCLTVGSKNTQVDGNNVAATADILFIAICMDDLSDVQVTNNHITNYVIGLCVQTNGALVSGNTVTNSCIGAFVDPSVEGAQVLDNHISDGNQICASFPGAGITGVALAGAAGTQVKENLIERMKGVPDLNVFGVGVAILDDATTGTIAVGNVVVGNVFKDNDFDIYVNTTGTGNVIEENQCTLPVELCG